MCLLVVMRERDDFVVLFFFDAFLFCSSTQHTHKHLFCWLRTARSFFTSHPLGRIGYAARDDHSSSRSARRLVVYCAAWTVGGGMEL